jgi:hypothetical protein
VSAPRLTLTRHGLSVGFRDAEGPAVVHFETPSRLSPEAARYLGTPGEGPPVSPVVSHARDGARSIAWVDDRGVARTAWGSTPTKAERLGEGYAVEDVPGAGLLLADADGLRHWRRGATRRVLSHRRTGAVLAADGRGAAPAAVAAYPAESSFFALALTRDGQAVRHRIPAPCRTADLRSVRTRSAFALGLEDGRVVVGVMAADGRLAVRPHRLFRGAPPLMDPRVLWVNDAFWVVARQPSTGQWRARPLADDDGRAELFLEGSERSFAAAYRGHRLVLVEVRRGDGEGPATLRMLRTDRRGEQTQRSERPLEVPGAAGRRRRAAARRYLGRLGQRAASRGYREGARPWRLDPDADRLVVPTSSAAVSIDLELDRREAAELRVVLGQAELPSASVLSWLAAWWGRRPPAWALRAAGALGAELLGARDGEAGRALALRLPQGLPAVEELWAWVDDLRQS